MESKKIRDILKFDALQEAENITGESYKQCGTTESLGFLLHLESSQRKNELLSSLGDSTFSNTEENYLKIVTSIGFESLLVEPFTNENGVEERFHVMWNEESSILLTFDTYTCGDDGSWAKSGKEVPPPDVNSGKFYYNWSPNLKCENRCTSSGGMVGNGDVKNKTYSMSFNSDFTPHLLPDELRSIEPTLDWEKYDAYQKAFDEWCVKVDTYIEANQLISIWSGDHDCREAIKFNISQLKENGTFVKNWIKPPFLWLLHYMDTKVEGYDHEAITMERLKKLPEHVVEAMAIRFGSPK